ncbi:MAG: QueT transporter family protein [Oscillospiraceae bacterium]
MHKFSVRDLTLAAMVAALYAVMSYFGNIFGMTYFGIQFRFAEALTVLPFLFPATAPGLFVGCFIANILSPFGALDVVFGSLATLLAAFLTMKMPSKWLAPLPPVLCNGLIVGALIAVSSAQSGESFWAAFALSGVNVALGELGACYALGMILLIALPKIPYFRAQMTQNHLA